MDKLQLEVLTPGRILLETEADHVVLPGSMERWEFFHNTFLSSPCSTVAS